MIIPYPGVRLQTVQMERIHFSAETAAAGRGKIPRPAAAVSRCVSQFNLRFGRFMPLRRQNRAWGVRRAMRRG